MAVSSVLAAVVLRVLVGALSLPNSPPHTPYIEPKREGLASLPASPRATATPCAWRGCGFRDLRVGPVRPGR